MATRELTGPGAHESPYRRWDAAQFRENRSADRRAGPSARASADPRPYWAALQRRDVRPTQTAEIMTRIGPVMIEVRPDVVVVGVI